MAGLHNYDICESHARSAGRACSFMVWPDRPMGVLRVSRFKIAQGQTCQHRSCRIQALGERSCVSRSWQHLFNLSQDPSQSSSIPLTYPESKTGDRKSTSSAICRCKDHHQGCRSSFTSALLHSGRLSSCARSLNPARDPSRANDDDDDLDHSHTHHNTC